MFSVIIGEQLHVANFFKLLIFVYPLKIQYQDQCHTCKSDWMEGLTAVKHSCCLVSAMMRTVDYTHLGCVYWALNCNSQIIYCEINGSFNTLKYMSLYLLKCSTSMSTYMHLVEARIGRTEERSGVDPY